jgi:predicted metal-binding membrane protein
MQRAARAHGRFATPVDAVSLLIVLLVVPAALWIWIVLMARDMYGPMTGASAWMMTPTWDAAHLLLLWAMWAGMMAAMMLPSATPLVLLAARRKGPASTRVDVLAIAAGYVTIWAAFSLSATILQRSLARISLLSPMMETTTPIAAAVLLLIAGIYQWTPIKRACLRTCQSPVDFLMRHWRAGRTGAFRIGLVHGVYCVGCCWALMLLLFVGGVMHLTTIAGLAAFVTVEKLGWLGSRGTTVAGAILLTAAVWTLVR